MSQTPYYASTGYANQQQQPPVVVVGTAVPSKPASAYDHDTALNPTAYGGGGVGEVKHGEPQPKRCNDVFWAILFFANLGVMAWVAATYVPQMKALVESQYDAYSDGGGRRHLLQGLGPSWMTTRGLEDGDAAGDDGDNAEDGGADGSDYDYNDYDNQSETNVSAADIVTLVFIAGGLSLVMSGLALGFMMRFARGLIKIALILNVLSGLFLCVLGALSGQILAAVMGLAIFALTAWYAYVVWERIPFAACNMTTAISAVRANFGVTFFAYSSLLVLLLWNVWFVMAFGSFVYVTQAENMDEDQQAQDGDEAEDGEYYGNPSPVAGVVMFLFLISYYWTHQVVKNHLHVTVAGTVGTWWFAPGDASSCCSSAVRDSFVRASTLSFGSICLGSLIVAIIQAVREMCHQMREQGDSALLCIAECILGCIESIAEYFNQWAYVYVGLYGYSFIEAGKNVMTLFQERGWTSIITDNLIDRVLVMISFVVGLIIGLLTVLLAKAQGMVFGDDVGGYFGPFLVGAIIGMVLTSILMNVVGSAVNTVIVCYAEAPNEFQQNHPQLSNDMRAAWRQAWPSDFKY